MFHFYWFGLDGCAVNASGSLTHTLSFLIGASFLVVPVESAAMAQFGLMRTAQAGDA
jgi:hypothetical protein